MTIMLLAGFAALAGAGALARYRFKTMRHRPEAVALGGVATGLLSVWMMLSLARASWMLFLGSSLRVVDFVVAPVLIFGIELWVLAACLALEAKYFLGGRYSADLEWSASIRDGMKTGCVVICFTTFLAAVWWWMVRPADYGTFDGTLVSGWLVSESAVRIFERISGPVELGAVSSNENLQAAVHCVVLSVVSIPIVLAVLMYVRYVAKVLGLWYPRQEIPVVPSSRWGRGGGLN